MSFQYQDSCVLGQADPGSAWVLRLQSYLPIALAYAKRSKDPSSQVGALIFGPNMENRSQGWNGAPRKSKADEDHRWADRSSKLAWSVHAEANAIANAAFIGAPTSGCWMLVTHHPCMSCAKLIVQAGLSGVVCPVPEAGFALRWAEDIHNTRQLFQEVGVSFRMI